MDNQKEWLDMIMKLYPKLHLDNRVEKRSNNNDKKRQKVINWLNKIEEVHDKVAEKHDDHLEQLYKAMYYQHYIIKEENIPENYYDNQKRLARERGFGAIEMTPEIKHSLAMEIINNQKESLDKWIEYFLYDEESKSYPMWEKFWVFQGLQKLGKYDKETGKFSKRKKTTIYPFPPVEKEAIFTTLNLMEEFLKDRTSPEEIREALSVGNFKRLYEFSLQQILEKGNREITSDEGIWIKYNQGSDYHKLRNSLQEHYTGWCTAAGENFAKGQLSRGDFYVYYSKDKNGEYKVPRIAIRMNGKNEIGEIRGIAKDQNIESEMMPILSKKLEEFPDRDKYYKKESDMKTLTQIEYKTDHNIDLTEEEVLFLHEINSKIEGFGWKKDPRIEEIKKKRINQPKDIIILKKHLAKEYKLDEYVEKYNCSYEEIGIAKYENYDSSKHKIWIGDLNIYDRENNQNIILPKVIKGNISIDWLKTAEGITLPEIIDGNLSLKSLETTKGLKLPTEINSLYLNSIKTIDELELPKIIKGDLDLGSLISPKGLNLPEKIGGDLNLSSLKTIRGLTLPEEVGGTLNLLSIEKEDNIILPKEVGKNLYLHNLVMVGNQIVFPKRVGGEINLQWFIPKENQQIIFPEEVGGNLLIKNMKVENDIVLPKKIKGMINIENELYYKTYLIKKMRKIRKENKKSDLDKLLDKLLASIDEMNTKTSSRGR
ncbi:MAG: hypothetical protein VZS44_03595 [Bacilli bacterium]|nr:hypothetical protein [Bacilli bacterium]